VLRRLAEGVFSWTAAVPSNSRPGVTYAHTGFALALPAAGGVVLVDPPRLTEDTPGNAQPRLNGDAS
jgi:hypothetical protein